MISCFQNAFVPLQKSLIASLSMAFACNAVERVVERAGLVRGALVAVARAAGRVRGCATNAVALLESHKSTRILHEGCIGPWSMDNSECECQWTEMRSIRVESQPSQKRSVS